MSKSRYPLARYAPVHRIAVPIPRTSNQAFRIGATFVGIGIILALLGR